jgi:sterol desaturase/sphingolipid hydroxylase (fatty acid hydroxylase superfamily)
MWAVSGGCGLLSRAPRATHHRLCSNVSEWCSMDQIPVRGKHLDVLRPMDICCIAFSKANTAPFTYIYLRYCYFSENVLWDIHSCLSVASLMQHVVVPLMVLFLFFDFTYSIFHGILHIPWIYPYIHKHHHIQKAPSRANVDAVNVHPVEFLGGEYNHLLVLYVYTSVLQQRVHCITTLLFLVVGGLLAGINHTRYDVTISIPIPNILSLYQECFAPPAKPFPSQRTRSLLYFWTVYDSKSHDVHHRIPQSNYGQYLMIWDFLLGTYRYVLDCVAEWFDFHFLSNSSVVIVYTRRPYNPNDRINPDSQLDPKTGMTRIRR